MSGDGEPQKAREQGGVLFTWLLKTVVRGKRNRPPKTHTPRQAWSGDGQLML